VSYSLSLANLAKLFQMQGKATGAEKLLRRAMEVCKNSIGNQSAEFAELRHSLAAVYRSQKRFTEAARLERQGS